MTQRLNSIKSNKHPVVSGELARKLSDIIQECLQGESANNLASICDGYGLSPGTKEEAFKSKYNYVHSRIAFLEQDEILKLGMKIKGKYPNSNLDEFLEKIVDEDKRGIISEFDNIQNILIHEIKKAEFIIWIAVAWFTDSNIANVLYSKLKEGLCIQIILNDDDINSTLKEKLNKYFDVYWVPNCSCYDKLMHNKFCVIDIKTVVHGSYNWTNKAKYNNETISVINDRITAEDFAKQFLKLRQELINKTK